MSEPGVVDENVDGPQFIISSLHKILDVDWLADISSDRDCRALFSIDRVTYGFRASVVVVITNRHSRAQVSEHFRASSTDTG
jgi:hypothetical protein